MTAEQIQAVKELRDACDLLILHASAMQDQLREEEITPIFRNTKRRIKQATEAIKKVEAFIV